MIFDYSYFDLIDKSERSPFKYFKYYGEHDNIKDEFELDKIPLCFNPINKVLTLLKKGVTRELGFTFENLLKLDMDTIEDIEKFVEKYEIIKKRAMDEFKEENDLN